MPSNRSGAARCFGDAAADLFGPRLRSAPTRDDRDARAGHSAFLIDNLSRVVWTRIARRFRYAVCTFSNSLARREASRAYQLHECRKNHMLAITQVPIVVAAAQYSLIYLLLGGGFGGAILIYIVAKMLGK